MVYVDSMITFCFLALGKENRAETDGNVIIFLKYIYGLKTKLLKIKS